MKITIIVVSILIIVGCSALYFVRQKNVNKQMDWNTVFAWTGIKALPDWAKNVEINLTPNSGSNKLVGTYVVTFDADSVDQISAWIKSEPALLNAPVNNNDKSLPVFILDPQRGSSYDEVKIDLVNKKISIKAMDI